MSNKDREAFEKWCDHEHFGFPFPALWQAWQAARDHYALKMTEKEFTDVLNMATIAKWRGGEMGTTIKEVVAALRAAGITFREEV